MNAIVTVTFKLNVPEKVIEKLMDRTDDGSEEYHEKSLEKLEEAVGEDFDTYSQYIIDDPDVEADG